MADNKTESTGAPGPSRQQLIRSVMQDASLTPHEKQIRMREIMSSSTRRESGGSSPSTRAGEEAAAETVVVVEPIYTVDIQCKSCSFNGSSSGYCSFHWKALAAEEKRKANAEQQVLEPERKRARTRAAKTKAKQVATSHQQKERFESYLQRTLSGIKESECSFVCCAETLTGYTTTRAIDDKASGNVVLQRDSKYKGYTVDHIFWGESSSHPGDFQCALIRKEEEGARIFNVDSSVAAPASNAGGGPEQKQHQRITMGVFVWLSCSIVDASTAGLLDYTKEGHRTHARAFFRKVVEPFRESAESLCWDGMFDAPRVACVSAESLECRSLDPQPATASDVVQTFFEFFRIDPNEKASAKLTPHKTAFITPEGFQHEDEDETENEDETESESENEDFERDSIEVAEKCSNLLLSSTKDGTMVEIEFQHEAERWLPILYCGALKAELGGGILLLIGYYRPD